MTAATLTTFRNGQSNAGLFSYSSVFAITPSDVADLTPNFARGLWTGTGGSISVILVDDTTEITLTNVPAGAILPLFVARVRATGTTATNLRGLR
jgi:hypothetical protein